MSDVTVTVAGFAGTTPRLFASDNGNDFTSFRVAHTKRYLDHQSGQWMDGRTTWFTVKAWRSMARNVANSVRKGDPVVVTGRLGVEEWSGPEGLRTTLVVEATALGPDLSRGTASFAHTVYKRDTSGNGDTRPDGARGPGLHASGAPAQDGGAAHGFERSAAGTDGFGSLTDAERDPGADLEADAEAGLGSDLDAEVSGELDGAYDDELEPALTA